MTAPNEAALKLAQNIADAECAYMWSSACTGTLENKLAYRAALAAIEKTTGLAATNISVRHGFPTRGYEPGYSDVLALRSYEHLKGTTDE